MLTIALKQVAAALIPIALFASGPYTERRPFRLSDGRNVRSSEIQIDEQEADFILHELFPGEWSDHKPKLQGAVRGSFTTVGADEVFAVGYFYNPSAHREYGPNLSRSGVFHRGRAVALNVENGENWNSVYRAIDLNGDGFDEILVGSSGMRQGHSFEYLNVVSAQSGKIRGLISFPLSTSDDGTGDSPYNEHASVITFKGGDPRKPRSYSVQYYSRQVSETNLNPNWIVLRSRWKD